MDRFPIRYSCSIRKFCCLFYYIYEYKDSLMTMLLLNVQRCKTRPSNSRDYVSTPCMYYFIYFNPVHTYISPFVILLYFLHQPTTSDEPTKAPATEGNDRGNQGTIAPSKGPSVSPSKGPSVSPTKEVSLLKSSLNISHVFIFRKRIPYHFGCLV